MILALFTSSNEVDTMTARSGPAARKLCRIVVQIEVGQYNILAGYMGSNTEPWFLYGVDIDEAARFHRRSWIMFACGAGFFPERLAPLYC